MRSTSSLLDRISDRSRALTPTPVPLKPKPKPIPTLLEQIQTLNEQFNNYHKQTNHKFQELRNLYNISLTYSILSSASTIATINQLKDTDELKKELANLKKEKEEIEGKYQSLMEEVSVLKKEKPKVEDEKKS